VKENYQVIIVGGGSAGVMVAAQLKKKNLQLDVAIIDGATEHFFRPSWPFVSAGITKLENSRKNMADVIPDGVAWIKKYVSSFVPEKNQVVTEDGAKYKYNFLVVCPGIKIDPELIEGLTDAMDKGVVCSNYTKPEHALEVLQNFQGGTALFTQPATLIKCSGAPQKTMYLAEDLFKKTGVREQTKIVYAIPGDRVFGVERIRERLMQVIDRKDINVRFFHKLVKVDGDKKIAWYKITKKWKDGLYPIKKDEKTVLDSDIQYNYKDVEVSEKDGLFGIHFDMMYLAPPQSAPDFIRDSPLSNEHGWVAVDQNTLQHLAYENIFSLGDVAFLPTAKTYSAITKQVPVVVNNILRLINASGLPEGRYNGYSCCQIATGYGKMIWAEFDYSLKFTPNPFLRTHLLIRDSSKEHWRLWLLKRYIMPYYYWNKALKGGDIWK